MLRPFHILALAAAISAAQPSAAATSQQALDRFAAQMGVTLKILDNKPASCPQGADGCFLSELTLRMPAAMSADLANGDFKIFFSSVAPVIKVEGDGLRMRWINGDLHVLEGLPGAGFKANASYRYRIWSRGHFFSAYYPMPNMFLVSGNLTPRVIAATRALVDPVTGIERVPFVAPMTDEARLGTAGGDDDTRWMTPGRAFDVYASRLMAVERPDVVIVPTPARVERPGGAAIDLRNGVRVQLSGIARSAIAPALAGLARSGVPHLDRGPELLVRIAPRSLPAEGYRVTAAGNRIRIEARDAAGASNALRSLAQQVAYEGAILRPLTVEDSPRLPFRGLHIDIARNFHSKAELLKIVEQMSIYKLNKLHLHLGEDEGWRLEIPALPELTQVGAYRCYDPTETRCLLPQLGAGPDRNSPVNGYLTQQDYREILLAAKARSIEVIPEFDMPGHSRAAIRSMEARYRRLMALGRKAEAERFRLVEPEDRTEYRSVQNYTDNTLNVCLDSTYRFVDTVVGELVRLHASVGTPLKTYHLGADETAGAWSQSPACKTVMASTSRSPQKLGAMFVERVSQRLSKRGIQVAGWSDGLGHVDPARMPAAVQSNIWGDLFTAAPAEAYRHANRGWKAVISVPNTLYFDVPYAPDPLERGLDWPTRGTDTFKVFTFMPENLSANASVMKDIHNKPTTVGDTERLQAGRSISGLQAQLWSETVRTDSTVDYMLFPRLLAAAERAWHRGAWEPAYSPGTTYRYADGQVSMAGINADWASFTAKMPEQLRQLRQAGVFYRIAPPGARVERGMLEANSEFPGAERVEYRVGEGPWTLYSSPVRVGARGAIQVRTRSTDGRRTSRTVEVLR